MGAKSNIGQSLTNENVGIGIVPVDGGAKLQVEGDASATSLAGTSNRSVFADLNGRLITVAGYAAEDAVNKQNNLTADGTGTKYLTVDAVNLALITKADLVGGLVPVNQLPSYVDDVLEFANLAAFSATGEIGKIYIALDSNKQYRWTGSAYLQITNGFIASTNDVPEGVSNLYFTASRVINSILAGLSTASSTIITGADSVLSAIGKLQGQITGHVGNLNNPHSVTKTQVGLSNVDNTSDASKPVSTAAQTALNLKANLNAPTFTGTVSGISKSMVGLSNVDNTSDAAKPVSTAAQTALNLKENFFTKNTAFNKAFGTAAGEVAQGNDSRIINGQTAFNWGNHAGKYMTQGETLLDPNVIKNGGNRYDPSANLPSNNHHAILTYGNGGNVTGQIATHFVNGEMSSRGFNSAWSAWRTMRDTINFVSGIGAANWTAGNDARLSDSRNPLSHTLASHSGILADSQLSGTYTGLTNLTGAGSVDFAKFLGLLADTATTPSFTWTGDLTTGIYHPTTSQIAIGIAGVQRALFSGSGLAVSGTVSATTFSGPLSGRSTKAIAIEFDDGPRNLTNRLPNVQTRTVWFDFVNSGLANGVGNYGGVMTFAPWTGTTASTGDSSYQLAFANKTGVNASGQPKLSIRNGIDTTWNAWYEIMHAGNIGDQSVSYAATAGSATTATTANNLVNGGGRAASAGSQFLSIDSTNAWAYLSLKKNGSTIWDIAQSNGGVLEFRSAGASSTMSLSASGAISLNGKSAIDGSDAWLRINQNNNFTSGIYCSTGILRTDGQLQVGSAGNSFLANGSGTTIGTLAGTASVSHLFYGTDTATSGRLRATTGGNVHLDGSGAGALYLNYFSGSGGVHFGNAANGSNANVSAAGQFSGTRLQTVSAGVTTTMGALNSTWNHMNTSATAGWYFYNPISLAGGTNIQVNRVDSANFYGGFNGNGTGLTGTATALNIGGNAATSRRINIGTTSSITDLNMLPNDNAVRFDTFTSTAANKPFAGNNANGVITFTTNHGTQYGKQISFADNDDLYIRRLTVSGFGSWLSVIHSGNIGSQTVNYANTAGKAAEATNNLFYVRGTSPSILFNDTDQGQTRWVHHNGGAIGFLNSSSSWSLRCADGAGEYTGTFTATAFFATSDIRLKDIISRDGDTVRFNWKDKRDELVHIGYIAQEVQEIYPDQVNTDEKGILSVNYIEVLVDKVRTLESVIQKHEKRFADLEEKIKNLTNNL